MMFTAEQLGVFKPLKTPKQKWETYLLNERTFIDYLNRLQNIALNTFEWKNLPDTVSERFLELTLCTLGYALFFEDEELGYLALTCAANGPFDVYRIPVYRRAYATNQYQATRNNQDSVLIYNNYLHQSTMETLVLFARRLYEIERTIDVNIKAQKTPVLLSCEESQILTVKNAYKEWSENEPVIVKYRNNDWGPLTVLKTDAPFVADKLEMLKKQIWSEAMTFLGVETVISEKKERLVSDEVIGNLGSVEAQRFVMLNSRREAADKINRMFGLNIQVDFRQNRGEINWPTTQLQSQNFSQQDTNLTSETIPFGMKATGND